MPELPSADTSADNYNYTHTDTKKNKNNCTDNETNSDSDRLTFAMGDGKDETFHNARTGDIFFENSSCSRFYRQWQRPEKSEQLPHLYENIKFDLRFSQKLLLQKLFRNQQTDVIYENLCRGCGYGVFESNGTLCHFCACIVNGLKSRQVRESAEGSCVYVDTDENIYENVCGNCSEFYTAEACEVCNIKPLHDNPCRSESSSGLHQNKRNKRSIFHGLFGSLKRSVKTTQSAVSRTRESASSERKQLEIIHNVDGFNNVFHTQGTFDLQQICELKRSQSSDQPIYGRLKPKNMEDEVNCCSTQTLPTKLEQSQSSDPPALMKKIRFNKKRPRLSKLHFLCSKENIFVDEDTQQYHQRKSTKHPLYLTDSVCQWMKLLRYQEEKYCSFSLYAEDDDYAYCFPKSIPPKNAPINYINIFNIKISDMQPIPAELFTENKDVFSCNKFSSRNQYTELALFRMVNDFKSKLISKQLQHQHWNQREQYAKRHQSHFLPSLGATSLAEARFVEQSPNNGAVLMDISCPSEHSPTLATSAQLFSNVDVERLSSCCAHCHVISSAVDHGGLHETVNEIHSCLCSLDSNPAFESRCETVSESVNVRDDSQVFITSKTFNIEERKSANVPLETISFWSSDSNFCSIDEIDKSATTKQLKLERGASPQSNNLDLFQIVSDSLISMSLNKIVIYYEKPLLIFLRNIHYNINGARSSQINLSHDQLLRKYEQFHSRLKGAFRAPIIESSYKSEGGGSDCFGGGDCGGGALVDVTSNQANVLNESVVRDTTSVQSALNKFNYCEGKIRETIHDKQRAQIVVKHVTVSSCMELLSHYNNRNASLIMKKNERENDQENFGKMKSNEEVVLRPKSKEIVDRSKKAQGTFLDSTSGSNPSHCNIEKSNAINYKYIPNEKTSVSSGESAGIRTSTQMPLALNETSSSPTLDMLITASQQTTRTAIKRTEEKEEDIYQPIWKFKTVGEAKEYYDESVSGPIRPNAFASDYVEDHGEWETDDEFQYEKHGGRERLKKVNEASLSSMVDISSTGCITPHSLSAVSESTIGSTITGFESSTVTMESTASRKFKHSLLRNVGIFYSLTDPKFRAIIYDYDRTFACFYFAKNRQPAPSQHPKSSPTELNYSSIKTKENYAEKSFNLHPEQIEKTQLISKKPFLPDSVQAWKFLLLDISYGEDEEDMIVSESGILHAQKFKENPIDAQTQYPGQHSYSLQRFKSASSGNITNLPIEDDKKSIAERMRNKLQRGVFKLNMRSPKSEKKSRGIFRRMETGSLYLEEGLKPKYPIFGAPLDQLEMDEATHPHVPRFVVDCVACIERKDCILQDGLYRASGNKVAIDDLKQKLSDGYIYDSRLLVTDDIHTLSSLLKQFFRELPGPLIPQQTYEYFCRNIVDVIGLEMLRQSFEDMCEPNRSTLKFLIRHLKNVAAYSATNRMPASNLAIVWGPCIFSANQVEFVDIGRMNTLAKLLIENYECIFSESERLVS